jgi:outer membrane lipoprotein LolB
MMNFLKPLTIYPLCFLIACTPIKKPTEMPLGPNYPTTQPAEPNQKNQITSSEKKSAQQISTWELSGAIAARNKNKSWTASMNWAQVARDQYQIRLYGPLGGGTVMVEKNGTIITFRDGAKKVASTDADKLLLSQTGVRLPVNNLYYWVRGLPAPGPVGSEHRDANQHLLQLSQAGYTITYSQYTIVNGSTLPTKIRLEGHGVMIKVAITRWKI